jgi:hypothetical protein
MPIGDCQGATEPICPLMHTLQAEMLLWRAIKLPPERNAYAVIANAQA